MKPSDRATISNFIREYMNNSLPEQLQEKIDQHTKEIDKKITDYTARRIAFFATGDVIAGDTMVKPIVEMYDAAPSRFHKYEELTNEIVIANNRGIFMKIYAVLREGLTDGSITKDRIGQIYIDTILSYLDNDLKSLTGETSKAGNRQFRRMLAAYGSMTKYIIASGYDINWYMALDTAERLSVFPKEDLKDDKRYLAKFYADEHMSTILDMIKGVITEVKHSTWSSPAVSGMFTYQSLIEETKPFPLELLKEDKDTNNQKESEQENKTSSTELLEEIEYPDIMQEFTEVLKDTKTKKRLEKKLDRTIVCDKPFGVFFRVCLYRCFFAKSVQLATEGVDMHVMMRNYELSNRELKELIAKAHVLLEKYCPQYVEGHKAYATLLAEKITSMYFEEMWMKAYRQVQSSIWESSGKTTPKKTGKKTFDQVLREAESQRDDALSSAKALEKKLKDERKKNTEQGKILKKTEKELRALKNKIEKKEREKEEQERKERECQQQEQKTNETTNQNAEAERLNYFERIISEKKVGIYGSRESLQFRCEKRWPDLIWIEKEAALGPEMLNSIDMIILRTDYISHSMYYQAKSQIKNAGIPFRHTSKEQNNEQYIIDAVIDMYETYFR